MWSAFLEQIVVAFKDAYSRPDAQIRLYRRYQDLQEKHEVKLIRGFVVISGGNKRALRHKAQPAWLGKRRLSGTGVKLTVIDAALTRQSCADVR